MKRILFAIVLVCMFGSYSWGVVFDSSSDSSISQSNPSGLREEDFAYLTALANDTFNCIAYFVDDQTDIPYDSSRQEPFTSISNIGLYLASISAGYEMGFLEKEEAVEKIQVTLNSLEQIEKWHNFPITWVNTETLERHFESSFSYADHVGNLLAGLFVVKEIFPEFEERINGYVSLMDFSVTYDERTGGLKGGYDIENQDFDIQQPWGDWFYNLLASDTRIFSLYGVASGQIPRRHWDSLNRNYNSWMNEAILYPGFEGGGIFMQYLPGIFIDEEGTKMHESAYNFAKAQIQYAAELNYPVWGWSASEAPDGRYLGWGSLKGEVVTPHASVLAIEDFPLEVVANLRVLEELGVRAPFIIDGEEHDFGFRDSYNIETKDVCSEYLLLDQYMLFLSLANFLHNEVVRQSFSNDPVIQAGLEELRNNY
ncbi:MAG: glucoamylase family protein [Candidatus Saelkia tenebricola]|nr:glucoamylase family protein [Candidatus Saelkia tenebricola]